MNEKRFINSYAEIIIAIDYCLSEKLILPALILIYTAIDSVSWIASDDENQKVRERFQIWVNTWMLQKYPLSCTAEELYAARCGILHTLTPDSDLSEKKGINRIMYAWGNALQTDLDTSIKLLEYPRYVAVHVNDIFLSFKNGFADYLQTLETDKVKKELFYEKANKHFVNMDSTVIKDFLHHSELIKGDKTVDG
jgi:hypothetical protein